MLLLHLPEPELEVDANPIESPLNQAVETLVVRENAFSSISSQFSFSCFGCSISSECSIIPYDYSSIYRC